MKRFISMGLMVLILLLSATAKAQHQEFTEKALMYKGNQSTAIDTTSLLYAFKAGSFHGHFRYFFMSTQNQKGLTDYYANAAGGGIRYETAKFHGFQLAVSGFYIFNIGSSDFTKADSVTGQYNRHEIALFDVTNPTNKKDLDRLEEFHLKYNFKNSNIVFGRQLINTPFINLQDGRMRPTGVEGIWLEVNEVKKIKIEVGWLYAITPRATVKWYEAGQSIGINSTGVNIDGTKSLYANNIKSKGVAVTGITTNINKNIKLQGWNMFTENVFNTAMLQVNINFPLHDSSALFVAAQFIRQDAVNDGGNIHPAKTYFVKGKKSITFGGKVGWKNKRWETSFNYNRITADGRYLVPREWGREPFFTFMPRERNDGLGDVHALMVKLNYTIPKATVKTSLSAGYYKLPDVKDYRVNKYGVPSYMQVNADVRYSFAAMMKGLEAQLLIVGKIKEGETYGNKKFEFNKVNMVLYNFVLNYNF
jgi:hypothetical protein